MEDFQKTRQQVEEAIRSLVSAEMISQRLDPELAVRAITDFVLRKEEMPAEETRYEWFYARRGLAVSIAEGWKANYLPEIKDAGDVAASIATYVRRTYGSNFDRIG